MGQASSPKRRIIATILAATVLAVMAIWVSPALAVPGDVTGLVSATHPDESTWYSSNSPSFAWDPTPADDSAIAGYSFVLDQKQYTVPNTTGGSNRLSFLPQVTYSVGSGPAEARIADLNGDGKPDLVVENDASNTVSVLLGNGDGTFAPKVDYATGAGPWSMAIGDVNGDGKIDVVTDNTAASSASVLINRGDGTFQPHVDYTTGAGSHPECLRMGDVNGDGKLDIFTANAGTNNVSVLLNNGDGTFGAPTSFSTATHPTAIDLCDLNGDGKQDLATANYDARSVSVLMGNGDGTFQSAVNYAVSGNPQMVLAADLNRDGKPDLATVDWGTNTASILLNHGDGTFAAKVDYAIGNGPYAFSVADLDQDGTPDLVTTNHSANSVSVLFGNGDGTFAPKIDLATGNGPFFVALGDLNGDGYGDLIATNMSDGTVSVLLGTEYFRSATSILAASFTGKADGTWYFHVRAVNEAGEAGATTTRIVRIDTTAPTVTSSADADTSWHSGDVDVTLTTDDGSGSGIAKAQYRAGTSGTWTDVSGDRFTIPAAGENGPVTYQYKAVDKAGNETTGSCTVNFDTTAPTSSDSSTPALAGDGDSAWRTTSQTVSLAATDSGGSGLAGTYYTLDGVQHTYSAPFDVSGDGSHPITYWSTDGAGNAEPAHSGWVNIWATPPVTSASAAVSDSADGGWQTNDPQPVTLTATNGHGTATIHYQVDGDVQMDVEGTKAGFVVSGEGSHRVTYWSTDSLGNAESQHTGYVKIDSTAPVTGNTYAGGSAWQTGPVSFSLTPVDSGSGMTGGSAGTTYQIDNGTPESGTDVTVAGDGEHTVTYSSTDNAGNVESVQTVTVRIDDAAPVTGNDGPTAWQNADTTVTLTPTDLLSGMTGGLAGTTFELDGGATQAGTSVYVAAPADHSNDGAHVITYRSTDAVGNLEADKTATVLIDTLPPVTHDDIVAGPPTHTDPVTVTLSASDTNGSRDVSGVATTHYRIDDDAWQTGTSVEITGDGQHTVSYYSTDNAGNDEAVKTSQTLTIGTTPPGASTDDAPAGWVNHDVTVTITPGERAVRTTYELDGGLTQTGTSVLVEAPTTHANDGTHVITYRSSTIGDVAETQRTAVVRIDTTAPQTSDDAPAGWQHGPVTLTLGASDAGSGVSSTTYAVDGGAAQEGTSVVVRGDGTHTVTYFSGDNAGNVEVARSATVRIDDTAPKVTCLQAGRWFRTKSVTARFRATDGASGVRNIAYRLGKGPWKAGSKVLIKGLGRHVVSFRATDKNGNVSAAKSCVIGIDRGRPTFVRGLPSSGRRNGLMVLRLSVQDPKPSCGRARVAKIVITNSHGKKVATIAKLGKVVRTNAAVKLVVKRKLSRGSYRFWVYVIDLAGNPQKKAIPGTLMVK